MNIFINRNIKLKKLMKIGGCGSTEHGFNYFSIVSFFKLFFG